ncbi:MAG: hypothetical protein Ct9H300mP14_04930 [Gammaproteobacteria bacterium]|nr:MAG: hypothetical protein Ct9H300mP14_04930 [Gammaproteobacteria bacterium]
MSITIYHNPRCSKSRATLALLHEHGHSPEIIEYLKSPPDSSTLPGSRTNWAYLYLNGAYGRAGIQRQQPGQCK